MHLKQTFSLIGKHLTALVLVLTFSLSVISVSAQAQTSGLDCDGEPLPPGAPSRNCSTPSLTTPVVPLRPSTDTSTGFQTRTSNPTTSPNIGSTRVVPFTGQQAQVQNQSQINPCTVGFCIGGLDNSRYTTGTGGQIALRIIIDISQIFTFVASAVAVLFIVYQGFKMVTSNGDEKQYKDSLKGIQYAVIGLIAVVVAYGLIGALVGAIDGLTLNNNGGNSSPRPTQAVPIRR